MQEITYTVYVAIEQEKAIQEAILVAAELYPRADHVLTYHAQEAAALIYSVTQPNDFYIHLHNLQRQEAILGYEACSIA